MGGDDTSQAKSPSSARCKNVESLQASSSSAPMLCVDVPAKYFWFLRKNLQRGDIGKDVRYLHYSRRWKLVDMSLVPEDAGKGGTLRQILYAAPANDARIDLYDEHAVRSL